MNLPRRELVQTIGEGEGQLKRFLLRALLWVFYGEINERLPRQRLCSKQRTGISCRALQLRPRS